MKLSGCLNGGGQLKAKNQLATPDDLVDDVTKTTISSDSSSPSTPTTTSSIASHSQSKQLLNKVKQIFNDAINNQPMKQQRETTTTNDGPIRFENTDLITNSKNKEPTVIEGMAEVKMVYAEWLDKLCKDELDRTLRTNYNVVPKMTSGLFTKW